MSDYADDETEKLLKKVEKKIGKEYQKAANETKKKYLDYMRRFRIKDDIKRQAMISGKITKTEYIEWRKQQILVGERFRALCDDLATDLHNTDMLANSMVKGYQPEVYALNRNYTAYVIETETGPIGGAFDLYSRTTVERLIRDEPKLLPDPKPGGKTAKKLAENKNLRWNKQKVTSALTQGILQGESIPKVAKRLESVAQMDHNSAIRNARTMVTGAQNAGRLDAEAEAAAYGVNVTNVWAATLDMRTRHAHRQLDGQRRKPGEPFEVDGYEIMFPGDPDAPPHLVYNCRCTLIPQVKGFERNIHGERTDYTKLGDLSYEEWKKSKIERPNPITLPEEKANAIKWANIAYYRKLRGK